MAEPCAEARTSIMSYFYGHMTLILIIFRVVPIFWQYMYIINYCLEWIWRCNWISMAEIMAKACAEARTSIMSDFFGHMTQILFIE